MEQTRILCYALENIADPQISGPQVSSSSDYPDLVMIVRLVETVHFIRVFEWISVNVWISMTETFQLSEHNQVKMILDQ